MGNMKKLYEKVSEDSVLQAKFEAIVEDAEKAGEKTTGEKLMSFAKEAGYDVALEEMHSFFKDLTEKKEGELSDVELDMVAGGKSTSGIFNIATSVASIGLACALGSGQHAALHALSPDQVTSCGECFQ